mmetsp:Transcript_8240/g.29796  ORF Transcript_8240/g.29796 Transcript_8240/m.29796 type:complete len:290 (-) Transcript_8240:145-1014(-)
MSAKLGNAMKARGVAPRCAVAPRATTRRNMRVASSGSDELFIPNSILGREASGFEFSPQAAGPQQAPPNPSVMERFQGVISQLFQQRIIRMGGAVDDDMANLIVAQLLYLDAADPKTDVTLYINSPGGSVTAGMAIFDTMRHVRPDVSTCCVGLAASMGAFLLASGEKGKRFALPNSRIMIHQPLGGTQGQAADIEIQANEILHHKLTLNGYLAEFSGQPMDKITKDTDRDYFMSGEEAKEYGLVDDVIQRPGVTLPPRDLKDIVEKGMENPYAMSIYDAADGNSTPAI